jgi:phosphatidylinositol glycan class N
LPWHYSWSVSPIHRYLANKAFLQVFKIIAPYIILSVTFAALNDALHLPPFSLFLVALTLTDGMTLTFFFNVTDTGQYQESKNARGLDLTQFQARGLKSDRR